MRGRAIPRRLGTLGLSEAELRRHIGWDIGIQGVTSRLVGPAGCCLHLSALFAPGDRLQPPGRIVAVDHGAGATAPMSRAIAV